MAQDYSLSPFSIGRNVHFGEKAYVAEFRSNM
jgi:hypothetical protein